MISAISSSCEMEQTGYFGWAGCYCQGGVALWGLQTGRLDCVVCRQTKGVM